MNIKLFRRGCLLVAVCLTLSITAAAQPRPHVIDKGGSHIDFEADSRFVSAPGFFGSWDAEVQLDPAKPENSSLKITIDAASINTRNRMRDNHLRQADFFDVQKYPQITYDSKKILKTGEGKYTVTGELTLRGVTKEVAVPLTLEFYANGRGRFRGSFALNRRDYGINYNSLMNPIKNIVQVKVDIVVIDKEVADKMRK